MHGWQSDFKHFFGRIPDGRQCLTIGSVPTDVLQKRFNRYSARVSVTRK